MIYNVCTHENEIYLIELFEAIFSTKYDYGYLKTTI